MLYKFHGDYARALPLFEQSLAIQKNVLGEHHPDYALSLNNLAQLYKIQGDYARALPLFEQATAITTGNLELTSAVQSERQQLAHSDQNKFFVDAFLSCSLLAGDFDANAYQQVIARKGSVLRRQRQIRLCARPVIRSNGDSGWECRAYRCAWRQSV